jgi:PmbA protein
MHANIQNWEKEALTYQSIASKLLQESKKAGATQAEVSCAKGTGFSVSVRMQEVDTLEYHQDKNIALTVYFGNKKGQASTTDISQTSLKNTIEAACRIAKLTQPDEAAGLAHAHDLAQHYPNLDLYHPWEITPHVAIELAKQCELQARQFDKRIINSEGVEIDTAEDMILYANSHGFMGHYFNTLHSLNCVLVAQAGAEDMQRDGSYTVSRDPNALQALEQLAQEAGQRTVRRLGARQLNTCQVPVIFHAEVASTLIKYFLNAISGRALYRQSSFLLNHIDHTIFPSFITIEDDPHILKGLGSAPFDAEGVVNQPRVLIEEGILRSYLLNSYSARRLGLSTTGHAGGAYNVKVSHQVSDLSHLLHQMGTGLLVTEVMGNGVNVVTGDYSQGAAGFWVEQGVIQYPVEEITIAGNLKDMYQNIIAVAGDIDRRHKIQTGSILIESMMVAGG